jgi:hypothetical protein
MHGLLPTCLPYSFRPMQLEGQEAQSATMQEEITMHHRSTVLVGLLCIACTVSWYVHSASGQAVGGWVTLFDGTNLDN